MNIIAAIDVKWGIGKGNGLLFKIPEDMTFFKNTTKGKVVVMGKNTFLSLPSGPLKNRINIILSSTIKKIDNAFVAKDFNDLRMQLKHFDTNDVYIIGGAQIYKEMLEYCDTAYITKIDLDGGAEVFLDNLDDSSNWRCVGERLAVTKEGFSLRFCTYKSISVKLFY